MWESAYHLRADVHDTQLFIDEDLVWFQDHSIAATRWSWPKTIVIRREQHPFSTASSSLMWEFCKRLRGAACVA